MKKTFSIIAFILTTVVCNAQWRIGINGGATYNHYSIDKHYMEDWHHKGAWGKMVMNYNEINIGTIGVMGQYDFNDWFGIRMDMNFTAKNHKQYRTLVDTDYETINKYFQVPVMASFSFGSKKIRGFLNAGIYGGYWLKSHNSGKQTFLESGISISGIVDNKFEKKRDQRFDYGLVCGAGLEWKFDFLKQKWAWQILEARVYYSTQSTQKDYMKIKDPKYNTTIALQSGLCYLF